jgi:hypothetical protein
MPILSHIEWARTRCSNLQPKLKVRGSTAIRARHCQWWQSRPRFIINMDQTPVYFSMSSKRTLEVIWKKTIQICTSTNDTMRVTVAVTITVDGTRLLSTLVFKGKPAGRM